MAGIHYSRNIWLYLKILTGFLSTEIYSDSVEVALDCFVHAKVVVSPL